MPWSAMVSALCPRRGDGLRGARPLRRDGVVAGRLEELPPGCPGGRVQPEAVDEKMVGMGCSVSRPATHSSFRPASRSRFSHLTPPARPARGSQSHDRSPARAAAPSVDRCGPRDPPTEGIRRHVAPPRLTARPPGSAPEHHRSLSVRRRLEHCIRHECPHLTGRRQARRPVPRRGPLRVQGPRGWRARGRN